MDYAITEVCNGCGACARACPTRAIQGAREQRHLIDLERCIDCGVCGMTCPVPGAVTGPGGQPCVRIKPKDRPRPHPIEGARCVSCNLCVEVCPFACLEMVLPEGKTDKRPVARLAHDRRCVSCRQCVNLCPTGYLEMRQMA